MKFLTRKEASAIRLINQKSTLTKDDKRTAILEINQNARLRSNNFKKPIKIALSVISNFRSNKIIEKHLNHDQA